ncbi:MAG TPA: UDP-glucuronic acid decarboxylase family protein [Bryobacteraceae bacterium]|nr:UDP-glucuronic acid decarboxylase family protein [Bryobacteraceae bacterium]
MPGAKFVYVNRIVVSGAAGFVASHLCERLLAEGYAVLGLDNFITGAERNIAHLRGNPAFEFRQQDVTIPFQVEGPVEYVIHAASPASPKDYLAHPIETLEVGSAGSRNMLTLAEEKGAKFLVTSTSESYGDPEVHPQVETYWGNVNPVGPRSCYDESKRYAEAITMAFHRSRGVKTSIARIFNTYGPRMKLNDGRVVPAFLDQALQDKPLTVFGDGSQTRSFCYVSDLVDGLYRLMLSDEVMPVNLGNPREMTILEFANTIIKMTGSKSTLTREPLPQDDPKQRQPDITKAKRVLGWEPKVTLEEGLQPTIEYFQGVIGKG